MDKVFWLVPGQIAGRSGPNKDPWQLSDFADAGFDLVVSLNCASGVDVSELDRYGIDHLHVELPPNIPPQAGDAKCCADGLNHAWQQLQPRLAQGQTVLIHCRSGKDRTGMLMAYLVMQLHKVAPAEAIAHVLQVRPIALSAEGWHSMALQVLSELEPQLGQFSA
ncbi:protein-tyrosine phosphatase family protein [Ferrimonas senticii]|uniref:protein-tyrosine phosphatase family protein n=1 Tax=Ferrimonas senticii TaxID=394566 RepID=UPI00041D45E9|nr:tyrosine-protein phosphatase [Ferrimonas senticii]